MRIIGGRFRGTKLASLGTGDNAAHLRPTPDRVRESLFNILNAQLVWEGLHVLDLFAGTGALGLEALSRGASKVTFVEQGRKSLSILEANIVKLNLHAQSNVLRCDATRPLELAHPQDLVFLDPPYGKNLGETALSAMRANLAAEALIVWEEARPQEPPDGYLLAEHRRYGATWLTFLRTP